VSNILYLSPLTLPVWIVGLLWFLLAKDGKRFPRARLDLDRQLRNVWSPSTEKNYYPSHGLPDALRRWRRRIEAWFRHLIH